jgi:hypothetical protein
MLVKGFCNGRIRYLQTKEKLEKSTSIEAGQFNTLRTVGCLIFWETRKQSAYIATEYILTDGPFNSPQKFNRQFIREIFSRIR